METQAALHTESRERLVVVQEAETAIPGNLAEAEAEVAAADYSPSWIVSCFMRALISAGCAAVS